MNRRIEIIPQDTIAAMQQYAWPGNIRELANVVERSTILSPGPTLEISVAELERPAARMSRAGARSDHPATLAELERAHILAVLEEANWLIAGPRGAAARLGMKRTTLPDDERNPDDKLKRASANDRRRDQRCWSAMASSLAGRVWPPRRAS